MEQHSTLSLDRLVDDPGAADALRDEDLPAMLANLAAVHVALSRRMLRLKRSSPSVAEREAHGRLMRAEEVAQLLGMSVRAIYRHADRWPFTRRLSRKCVRFDEAGLRRYIKTRPPLTSAVL